VKKVKPNSATKYVPKFVAENEYDAEMSYINLAFSNAVKRIEKQRQKANVWCDKARKGDVIAAQYLQTEFRLRQYTNQEIQQFKEV